MTLQEKYDELLKRMEKPENKEKYQILINNSNTKKYSIIRLYCKLIQNGLELIPILTEEKEPMALIDFHKSSCSANLRALEKLLNKEGWL